MKYRISARRIAAIKQSVRVVLLIASTLVPSWGQNQNSCTNLKNLINRVYNFKPSKLSPAEQKTKSAEMDKVWDAVRANPTELLPCLRAAIGEPQADPWFRFDGSRLLVEIDPSPTSKATQVKNWMSADLDDVDLRSWVETLTYRGTEGFDVSEGGRRWLEYSKAKYFVPEHAFEVGPAEGALFIFGSMDEAQATPALLKVLEQRGHPGREPALWVLMNQATTESLRALKELDPTGFSPQARGSLRALLSGPTLIKSRSNPKLTREDLLRVFEAAAKMD